MKQKKRTFFLNKKERSRERKTQTVDITQLIYQRSGSFLFQKK